MKMILIIDYSSDEFDAYRRDTVVGQKWMRAKTVKHSKYSEVIKGALCVARSGVLPDAISGDGA